MKRTPGRRQTSRRLERPELKELERIRLLAESADEDEIPPQLYMAVEEMVDRGLERQIRRLLEDGVLTEEASEALSIALEEAGYRLSFWRVPDTEEGGRASEAVPMVLIPFALVFGVAVLEKDLAQFPVQLPDTGCRASNGRLLRQALDLSEAAAIVLDPHLYRLDHEEWLQESAVRRYLKSLASAVGYPAESRAPLAPDFARPPQVESPGIAGSEERPDTAYLLHRVLCGAVVAEEGEPAIEVEDRLFAVPAEFGEEGGSLNELGSLVAEELASHGIESGGTLLMSPSPVELCEVPGVGLTLERGILIGQILHQAGAELAPIGASGEPVGPVLYASFHGEKQVPRELRVAVYAQDGSEEPFLTSVWEVHGELETPEEVAATVAQAAEKFGVELVLVEEFLPDERCPDCGERLFRGPSGPMHPPYQPE